MVRIRLVIAGVLSGFIVSVRLNTKLEANGYPPMTSLVKDLSDGVRLIQLMVRTFILGWINGSD